jgi:hypothetical protein
MGFTPLAYLLSITGLFLAFRWNRKQARFISRIPGPSSASAVLGELGSSNVTLKPAIRCISGNFVQYFQGGVGEYEFQWQAMYGAAYRFTGLFGVKISPSTHLIRF